MQTIKHPFSGQKPDEEVIMFVRRHWASFLGFVALVLAMIVIVAFLMITLIVFVPDFVINNQGPIILFSSAFLLFTLGFFLVGWIDFYFDIVIITDRRIIDIRQRGLFSRDIFELDILHVEDVSAKITGVLPTLFRYGDVYVQTAGSAPNFTFDAVPAPNKMTRQIMALYDVILKSQAHKIKAMDSAEGLTTRHFHPKGEEIRKLYKKELSDEQKFFEQQTSPQSSSQASPAGSGPESKIRKEPEDRTGSKSYKELLEKDQKNMDSSQNEGQLSEGEEVDFDRGKDDV